MLGKLIGVYLGRPFEGWTYERFTAELGEVDYFVNDRVPEQPPLVITDDNISGTFTGWGMVAPGDPEFAATLASRAASVSSIRNTRCVCESKARG